MDDSFDDEDPYDFKLQFERLIKEQKNKVPPKTAENTKKAEQIIQKPSDEAIILAKTIISNSIINKPESTTNTLPSRNRKRTRRQINNSTHTNVDGPIICIGDFDDGYNMPPPRQLDIETTNDEEIIKKKKLQDEEDQYALAALNRIVSVKVFWRKTRTHRFPLRRFQSIESIYEYFAKLENTNKSYVSLELNNISLSPSDTPYSINYKIVDFIDGDIEYYKSPFDTPTTVKSPDEEVSFRILQNKVKRPVIMSIKKTEEMKILYLKLSEKLGLDTSSFALFFDGDKIKITDTIESLDLEGDECIELFQTN